MKTGTKLYCHVGMHWYYSTARLLRSLHRSPTCNSCSTHTHSHSHSTTSNRCTLSVYGLRALIFQLPGIHHPHCWHLRTHCPMRHPLVFRLRLQHLASHFFHIFLQSIEHLREHLFMYTYSELVHGKKVGKVETEHRQCIPLDAIC